MKEISSCGIDMEEFIEGDIPRALLDANQLTDPKEFIGTWQDIKHISQPIESILYAAGVGFIKRKATVVATLTTEMTLERIDSKGNPVFYLKVYYPLGITKDCTVITDGLQVELSDPDTCTWMTKCVWCNGRLIQKRVGSNGVMYDSRVVLKAHPTLASDDSPVMLFLWTIIDSAGKKHQAECWMKKKAC